MKLDIQTEDKLIVDRLCRTERVSSYSLHQMYQLSAGQIVLAVRRLEQLGIAGFEGANIVRLPDFASKLVKWRHAIYHRELRWKSPSAIRRRRA
jgi:hypothetical protein